MKVIKQLIFGKKRGQEGLASIVIVMMLIIVITIVSLGLSRLVDRATKRISGANQASAATYAAKAGINDVISILSYKPNLFADKCKTLLVAGQPFYGANAQFNGLNTRYTCILVNNASSALNYQNILAYKSQVIAINPPTPIKRLMISWQSTNRSLIKAAPSGLSLYDETEWYSNKQYEPLMRVTLYREPPEQNLDNLDQDSRTFFLYPTMANAADDVTPIDFDTATGSILPASCGAKNQGNFDGTADFDCNVIIKSMKNDKAYRYYIRLTPYYFSADAKLKANDGSNRAIAFQNSQYVIDVTATSGTSVKRLQAYVTTGAANQAKSLMTSADDTFPEFAINSAATICKRLLIDTNAHTAVVDPNYVLYCNMPVAVNPSGGPPPSGPNNWTAPGTWDDATHTFTPGALPNSSYHQSSDNQENCSWGASGRYVAEAYHAADGRTGDCYDARTNTDSPSWWYVDLGQIRHIDHIVLKWTQAGYTFPFNLQGSNDSSCSGGWNTIKSGVGQSPSPVTIGSLNADYRCIRLKTTDTRSMRIGEIEIWDQ